MVLRDNVFGTPEDDALSRDFTINALFYNIADFSVIDYSTGLIDLSQKLIRPIGDPYTRFTEDPVRMLRAVRFAASHNFFIESSAWEAICKLSPAISRVDTSRLYEEIRKTFFFGFACPAFRLLDNCGLLAVLFPDLYRWINENNNHSLLLQINLENVDHVYRNGGSPSPALLFASLFGPFLDEKALVHKRDGVPHQQALDVACARFMEDIRTTINMPRRVGSQLRAILALQPSLRKIPPRRPASLAGRPEFIDALTYLRIMSVSERKTKPFRNGGTHFYQKLLLQFLKKNRLKKMLRKKEERVNAGIVKKL
jgi:poly(A) polymerase